MDRGAAEAVRGAPLRLCPRRWRGCCSLCRPPAPPAPLKGPRTAGPPRPPRSEVVWGWGEHKHRPGAARSIPAPRLVCGCRDFLNDSVKFKLPRGNVNGSSSSLSSFFSLLCPTPLPASLHPCGCRRLQDAFFAPLRGYCLEPVFAGFSTPNPSCPDSLPQLGILQINYLGWAQ